MSTKHVLSDYKYSQHFYEPAPCNHRNEKHVGLYYVVNMYIYHLPCIITVLELNI